MAATVWKGFISFGLVFFPVRLFAAARPETVHFHLLHKKDQSRVKEVWYCAEENKPIERSEIEKGYEVSKGEYVVLDDEELKKIAPPTATTMDVLQFVGSDDVDPIYFESLLRRRRRQDRQTLCSVYGGPDRHQAERHCQDCHA
jgi:DNA end-binding protein Ku